MSSGSPSVPLRKRSERKFCATAAGLAVLNLLTVTNPQRNVETGASVLHSECEFETLEAKAMGCTFALRAFFCLQNVSSWSSFLEPGCVQSSRNRYSRAKKSGSAMLCSDLCLCNIRTCHSDRLLTLSWPSHWAICRCLWTTRSLRSPKTVFLEVDYKNVHNIY